MTAVVTGASGFLGGAVVRRLLDDGRQVRAVDLVRGPTLSGLDVEFVEADVLNPDSLGPALQGADVVFHLVAKISIAGDPTGEVYRVNVDGVRNVAESAWAQGVKRMVHCSSVHAFDLETNGRMITERSPRSTTPTLPAYDRSKAAGETALREVIAKGLDAVVVNPTGIIGVHDYAPSPMGHVFRALFTHTLPALIEGGFDWVDSRDVAASIVAAEDNGATGENYLLPGHHQTVAQLADLAEKVSGVPKPRLTVPLWAAKAWSPIGDRLNRRSGSPLTFTRESIHALDHSPPIVGDKAQSTLGHQPRQVEETVSDIYEWFRRTG
ncbi:MAG: NAD-dependent epimerase/dehydratase family protein [Acidimicrobiia bacterium]